MAEQLRRCLQPHLVNNTRTVGTHDAGQANAGILAEGDPDIAAVERRGMKSNTHLTWTGFRRSDIFNGQLFGAAKLAEKDGFHRRES